MSANTTARDILLATSEVPDPGNAGTLQIGDRGIAFCSLKSAAAETRTVPSPSRLGQRLTLSMDTDGGDITVTVTDGITTSLTFDDANDTQVLEAIRVAGALKWKRLVTV